MDRLVHGCVRTLRGEDTFLLLFDEAHDFPAYHQHFFPDTGFRTYAQRP